MERSVELIKLKIKADKERLIVNFDGDPIIQVLNGRYGPFIQVSPTGKKKINVKIPKERDPKSLNRDDCLELMNKQFQEKK